MPAKSSAAAASRVTPSRNGTGASSRSASASAAATGAAKEPRILFQKHFKSIGTRTYAAQVKENDKGNHFLVLAPGSVIFEAQADPVLYKFEETHAHKDLVEGVQFSEVFSR